MDSLNCFGCKVWHDANLLVYYQDEGLYRCYECAYKHEKKNIAALEARLKEAEAVIKPVYVKHTQDAVNCNFQLCGCEYCEAYRKAFEKGAA